VVGAYHEDFTAPRPNRPLTARDTRIKLREDQSAAWAALTTNEGDKLLTLGCGRGKTILALLYAGYLGLRTLIVVDLDFLVQQWEQAIHKCYWMPRNRIGRVQGDELRIGDVFTIASLRTLVSRGYGQDFYDQFGLVIFDECHVIAAPTARGILEMVRGERLGLTATVERNDGLENVFKCHMGGEPCYVDLKRAQPSTWYFKATPHCVPEGLLSIDQLRLAERSNDAEARAFRASHCYRKIPRLRRRDGSPVYAIMRPRFESHACQSEAWGQMILHDLERMVKAGRQVLCLGSRKEHLRLLHQSLCEMGIDAGLATSEVQGEDRDAAFDSQVLLATWQLAYKALDIERLDTLVLLFPTDDDGFLRQAVGRIDRVQAGKNLPIVLVYEHGYDQSLAKSSAKMRAILPSVDPDVVIRKAKDERNLYQ
jgi:superfamily II DNA or RNA helicase